METNHICHFNAEINYDLAVHKEFMRANVDNSRRNTGISLFMTAYMIFIALYFEGRSFASIFLIGSAVYFFMRIISHIKYRNGGTEFKRILYQHDGKPPHQIFSFEDDGIRSKNTNTGNEQMHPYERVKSLIETKNLLLIMLDIKICLLLDKHSLTGGTKEELVAFMRSHCPNMKKRIKTGMLGRTIRRILYATLIIGSLIGVATLFDIPAKLSGQLTNNMTYSEIATELASLGINISEKSISELEAYDLDYSEEYGIDYYRDNYTSSKVLDLLCWEGGGTYDEETWEWTPSDSGVYWFDSEVMYVDKIYTDFLTGVSAMNEELSFSNIQEDYSKVNWEQGTGNVKVSFDWNGRNYTMDAEFYNDWFDSNFLFEFRNIIDENGNGKQLYVAFDGGQGYLIYYNTPDLASQFEKKTGIHFTDSYYYYS